MNLRKEELTLLNRSLIEYNKMIIPCCNKCNNERMSLLENEVKQAFDKGYNGVIKLNKTTLAWRLSKIYYANFANETRMRKFFGENDDSKILEINNMKYFEYVYDFMKESFDMPNYKGVMPYELYIFKVKPSTFDYMDSIFNTLYIQIEDIAIVFAINSFGELGKFFINDIKYLQTHKTIYSPQIAELHCKFAYFMEYTSIIHLKIQSKEYIYYTVAKIETEIYDHMLELNNSLLYLFKNKYKMEVILRNGFDGVHIVSLINREGSKAFSKNLIKK